ncbi:FAD/FMN-containing dehydrogenase [Pseudomonas sp. Marseille-QA0892]
MKTLPALLLMLVAFAAHAIEPGDTLETWTLKDQFDQPYTLSADTRIILVARSMTGSGLLDDALANKPKEYLPQRRAVFIGDIHRMPSAITKMFAIPAMKDYTYRVLLDRDGAIAARYPADNDSVLWLQLEDGKLVSQQAFADADALYDALEAAPVEP